MNERILLFIEYAGLSIAEFERKCGLSNGAVSKMGDNTRRSTIDRISIIFPDLNITWLLTGEGEMIKKPSQSIGEIQGNVQGVNVNGSVNINEAVDKFLDEISAQRKMTEKSMEHTQMCMEHIDRLIKLLETKD